MYLRRFNGHRAAGIGQQHLKRPGERAANTRPTPAPIPLPEIDEDSPLVVNDNFTISAGEMQSTKLHDHELQYNATDKERGVAYSDVNRSGQVRMIRIAPHHVLDNKQNLCGRGIRVWGVPVGSSNKQSSLSVTTTAESSAAVSQLERKSPTKMIL